MKLSPTDRKRQQDLFEPRLRAGSWAPPTHFPDLSGHRRVWYDAETDGNDKKRSRPCGLAIATEDQEWYFPYAHEEGGNLDKEKVLEWARRELAGKALHNINTGFDTEMLLHEGVDLEALGCTLHDVAHAEALIDENQFKGMSLNDLALKRLGKEKVKTGVRPENIHKAHSSLIGPYAEVDVALARDVDLDQQADLDKDDLRRVMALEDELIWANNHMERSGARLDMPKLEGWRLAMAEEYAGLALGIWAKTGVKLAPNSASSWDELYTALKIKKPEYPKSKERTGQYGMWLVSVPEGFTDDFLKREPHPLVKAGLRMRRLSSLQSKYTDKYWKAQSGGVLPFHLYQLRATEEDYGTVVGRYSSANVNIQQVYKCENQVKKFCSCGAKGDDPHHEDCVGLKYVIRELMVPDDGFDLFAVDGSQLQFRLFVHYSDDKQLVDAYWNEPDIDFHQLVANLFSLQRQAAKHNNFAMVLGMGREKLANRLGKSCTCDINWALEKALNRQLKRYYDEKVAFGFNRCHADGCPARESNDLADQYDKRFPAAKRLMQKVSQVAEDRGYICTLLGRRRRYFPGDKFYSALAGLLQGGEADLVKTKLNTLYRERKAIGIHKMRMPVHDEMTGDLERDMQARKRLNEACAEVEAHVRMKVPMVWDAKFGPNWKDMSKKWLHAAA